MRHDVTDRTRGIGGSDAAKIVLGVGLLELYAEKIGEAPPRATTARMAAGSAMEPVILAAYAESTGRTITTPEECLTHETLPWCIGHVDALAEDRIVEAKFVARGWGKYESSSPWTGWGEPGTDQIPVGYYWQATHYLAVTGRRVCDVAAWIDGDVHVYPIARDEAAIAQMLEREESFWRSVIDRTPPPPSTADEAMVAWPRLDPAKTIEADDEMLVLLADYDDLSTQERDCAAAKRAIRDQIAVALGDASAITHNGHVVATWKQQSRSAYSVEASTFRVLRVMR